MQFASNSALASFLLALLILSSLVLSGCSPPVETTEPSLAEQLTAIRNGSTDIILVESVPLDNDDLAVIVEAPDLRVLQLDHPGNTLTDEGMKEIARLVQLEHLRIRGGSIGDNGLNELSTMHNLRVLNLPQGKFTDAGLRHLKLLPKLEMLRIGSSQVTDAGIAALKEFPSLRQVHLIDIPITDRGLADLQSIPKLESLYLDGANISDAAVDALFKNHPNLHAHFNQAHHDRDPHKDDHSHP